MEADVIIWHLRGHKQAGRFIDNLYKDSELELWVGAMQRAEIVF